jgi:hypothetical protein
MHGSFLNNLRWRKIAASGKGGETVYPKLPEMHFEVAVFDTVVCRQRL